MVKQMAEKRMVMKPNFVGWPPTRKLGTGRRAIVASRLDRRIAKLEAEVREMAAPVVTVFDRDAGIGSIPANLKRYEVGAGGNSSGAASSLPFRNAS